MTATREVGFLKIWGWDAGFFACLLGMREVILAADANQTGVRSVVSPMKANQRVILLS